MINYIKGNVLSPVGEEQTKVICHVVNNKGGWGAGFVVALSKKWKKPEQEYRHYCKNNIPRLSHVQCVEVEAGIFVANMFAQNGFRSQQNPVALDYKSLTLCLVKVRNFCKFFDSLSIHMPLIGCGLAGGKWEKVGPMVEFHFENIPTYVYQL
jgi:O-acetyl-ADP-ribose deacetylase (regulator of RNase III)